MDKIVQSGKDTMADGEATINDISNDSTVTECDDEDKKLEEELNNSFVEYRDAQLKLIRCKNAIAAKKDLASREVSIHASHAAVPPEKNKSVVSQFVQNTVIQSTPVTKDNFEIRSVSKQTTNTHIQAVNSQVLNTNPMSGSVLKPNSVLESSSVSKQTTGSNIQSVFSQGLNAQAGNKNISESVSIQGGTKSQGSNTIPMPETDKLSIGNYFLT
ncbi:uncharacterized protein LOC113333487 [Papaver somniferum]|uniref:uncharacterized protein LOC113333487 n=1 Tax=Papaver somniferum TaxID=3469 RepID=UPI000E704590|nr:uncharacterized protein LOC113333487 [Papaver somniferum]